MSTRQGRLACGRRNRRNIELQPTNVRPPIEAHDLPAVHCQNVVGLGLADVAVAWDGDLPPYYSHGVACVGSVVVTIDGFDGSRPSRRRGRGNIATELFDRHRQGLVDTSHDRRIRLAGRQHISYRWGDGCRRQRRRTDGRCPGRGGKPERRPKRERTRTRADSGTVRADDEVTSVDLPSHTTVDVAGTITVRGRGGRRTVVAPGPGETA